MGISSELSQRRYLICKTCPQFNESLKICRQCGCYMPIKVALARSRCPLNLWTEEIPERPVDSQRPQKKSWKEWLQSKE